MTDNTEARLDRLEVSSAESNHRLGVVETQLKGISADVKTLVQSVATAAATPRHDFFKIIPALAGAVVIFTAVGGVITYIASNTNAAASARQEERLSFLHMRMDRGWFTASEMKIRAPNGVVTPQ